jgi:hypothetical protein
MVKKSLNSNIKENPYHRSKHYTDSPHLSNKGFARFVHIWANNSIEYGFVNPLTEYDIGTTKTNKRKKKDCSVHYRVCPPEILLLQSEKVIEEVYK